MTTFSYMPRFSHDVARGALGRLRCLGFVQNVGDEAAAAAKFEVDALHGV